MAKRRDWLPAPEAAALLSVKPATLYAYVSRGLVRSRPAGAGERGRTYARADLERLQARSRARRGHAAVAEGALLFGEPVLDTQVSSIDERGPRYRGQSALALAEADTSPERVAELLFTGKLPDRAPALRLPSSVPFERVRSAVTAKMPPLRSLLLVLAALEPGADDGLEAGRALVRLLAAAPALGKGLAVERAALTATSLSAALLAAFGKRPEPRRTRLLARALVLSADHELNASTFAARIAAGAGADLPCCLGAALAVFSGSRHGGACERIEALLAELRFPDQALVRARGHLERSEDVPGFGHPLYPNGDPRAAPLVVAAEALAPEEPRVRALAVLREAVRLAGGEPPTLDHALVAVAAALRLPPGCASVIFAVGRSIGYVAHALEQRASGQLLRPRARYVGP